jgi:hypothetical protein
MHVRRILRAVFEKWQQWCRQTRQHLIARPNLHRLAQLLQSIAHTNDPEILLRHLLDVSRIVPDPSLKAPVVVFVEKRLVRLVLRLSDMQARFSTRVAAPGPLSSREVSSSPNGGVPR